MSAGLMMPLELGYRREGLFAVELVDAVSLERVHDGVKVTAHGLQGRPVVNAGGLFVWLKEDLAALTRLQIDTGSLPLQARDVAAADVVPGINTFELAPRASYPFGRGATAIRGRLIKDRLPPPLVEEPEAGATIRLEWLDDDGLTWIAAPTRSLTDARGSFASVVRLATTDQPLLDPAGAMTVRLFMRQAGGAERSTLPFQIPQGRVADTATFAWDELQP